VRRSCRWVFDRPRGARGRLVVGRREIGSLSREKTIVLALVIQLFVAGFSSFLVVGLTSLYSPGSVSGGGVEVAVVGDAGEDVVEAAEAAGDVSARLYSDAAAAEAAFDAGRVDALVEARTIEGRIAVTVTAPEEGLKKTLVVVRVRSVLETLERTEREARAGSLESGIVPLPPPVDASPYLGFTYTVLVPMLLLLPAFIVGSVAVDGVTEEVERGTLELLRVTPLSLAAILEGKALALAALGPAQALLWVGLLSLNGIPVANLGLLAVFVTALSVTAVALGVGTTLLVADRQRAQLLYSFCVLGLLTAATALPAGPTSTAALLAIDSPRPLTAPAVVAYALLAVGLALLVRWYVGRVDPASL
jgi:ABC-type Na+ efflux pump permease subunit